jgi:hypothetical protein
LDKPNSSYLTHATLVLLGSALCYAFAIVARNAVSVDGSFLPYGNDAFYHAHRILEAATSGAGLQEFDPLMHVPEGSWLTWPWGFDWLLAVVVRVATWLNPGIDPMQVLVYVPVAWIPVNVFLLLGIFTVLNLRPEFKLLGISGFALAPLTQRLHGIGAIDHHFMELTFVLLTTLLLLRWMVRPTSRAAAVACGAALGLAQAFHHGLFILQLPLLATLVILWLRGALPPPAAMRAAAIALLVSTVVIAVPSGPLLDGQFSMTTLSWFHPYVAFSSAGLMVILSSKSFSWRSLAMIGGFALLLGVPAFSEVLYGAKFLSGQLLMLDQIIEMQSPLSMIAGDWGLAGTTGLYSWLILLAPVLLVAGACVAVTDTRPVDISFGILSVFGLGLLLMQLRLNYFGTGFLLVGPFYYVSRYLPLRSANRMWVLLASVAVFALAFRPVLSETLMRQRSLAGDHLYEVTRPLYPALRAACADEPGTVLAAPQFGHYIRFHTDCSVIANNFLLTELHFAKVREVNALFNLSVEQLAVEAPEVRYVFGFLADVYVQREGNIYLRDMNDILKRNPRLISELMLAEPRRASIEVLHEVPVDPDAEQSIPLAGVYRIR